MNIIRSNFVIGLFFDQLFIRLVYHFFFFFKPHNCSLGFYTSDYMHHGR